MNKITLKFINTKIEINNPLKWIFISILLLVSTILYVYQIGAESLQSDEIYSIYDAENLKFWWQSSRPLYYHLLKIWMLIDTSDSWLRGLSIIFGLGSILLIYRLGKVVAGESIGLISALLLTFSPLFINHVQEVRMYSLSTCLTLAGTLALVYALKTPKNLWLGLWSGLRYLAIMTTPINAVLLVPDLVLIISKFGRQRKILLNFSKWLILLGLVLLPNAIELVFNSGAKFMGIKDETGDLPSHSFSVDWSSVTKVIQKLFFLPNIFTAWPFSPPVSNVIAWFYKIYSTILICLLGFGLMQVKRFHKLAWIIAWTFLPLSLIVIVSLVSRSLMVNRYLLFICPHIFILIAAGLVQIWQGRARNITIVIAVVYAVAISGGLTRYYKTLDRDNWRSIGQFINSNERVGDKIVVSVPSFFRPPNARPEIVAGYYYDGSAPIHIIQRPWQNKEQISELFLQQLPPIESRLWIIYWQGSDKQYREFQNDIQHEFNIEKQDEFKNNIRVMLVRKNSAISN